MSASGPELAKRKLWRSGWVYPDRSFRPHAALRQYLAQQQPVVLPQRTRLNFTHSARLQRAILMEFEARLVRPIRKR